MLSGVQNYQITPSRVSFKSKDEDYAQNREQKPVYKTHAGLKTGIGYGIVEGSLAAFIASGAKFVQNILKENAAELGDEAAQAAKSLGKSSKAWFIYIPAAILTSLGCGALVDKKINDKQAKFADKLEQQGKQDVLRNDDNAEITKNEQVYCKTSIGKKLGTVLGLVITPLLGLAKTKIAGGRFTVSSAAINAVLGAVGGLTLGAITDKVANKGAAKFADKQAAINND